MSTVSSVQGYSNEQLLSRVQSAAKNFSTFPTNYWLLGIRSAEDVFNRFDDKFYLFKGTDFIKVWKGTTNAGTDLLNPSNSNGEAVLEADNMFYESHEYRSHKGKVMAYCQRIPLPIHRDNDRDTKSEELGAAKMELIGINIHPASYIIGSKLERDFINGWSEGCQVFAIRADFDVFMNLLKKQSRLSYCLLKEF